MFFRTPMTAEYTIEKLKEIYQRKLNCVSLAATD